MITIKRTLGFAMLTLLALLLVVPAMAADLPAGKMIELTQTKYGAEVNALGYVKISANAKGVETFGLVVFAEVKDEKVYAIEVTTPKGVFKVADLEMFLGTGMVRQTNLTHATKAFPIAKLLTVTVRDRGGVVLTGEF